MKTVLGIDYLFIGFSSSVEYRSRVRPVWLDIRLWLWLDDILWHDPLRTVQILIKSSTGLVHSLIKQLISLQARTPLRRSSNSGQWLWKFNEKRPYCTDYQLRAETHMQLISKWSNREITGPPSCQLCGPWRAVKFKFRTSSVHCWTGRSMACSLEIIAR